MLGYIHWFDVRKFRCGNVASARASSATSGPRLRWPGGWPSSGEETAGARSAPCRSRNKDPGNPPPAPHLGQKTLAGASSNKSLNLAALAFATVRVSGRRHLYNFLCSVCKWTAIYQNAYCIPREQCEFSNNGKLIENTKLMTTHYRSIPVDLMFGLLKRCNSEIMLLNYYNGLILRWSTQLNST